MTKHKPSSIERREEDRQGIGTYGRDAARDQTATNPVAPRVRFAPDLILPARTARKAAILRAGQRAIGNGAVQRVIDRLQQAQTVGVRTRPDRARRTVLRIPVVDAHSATAAVQRNGGQGAKSAGKTVIKPVKNKTYRIKAKTLAEAVTAMDARGSDKWGECKWKPNLSVSFDTTTGNVVAATVTVKITVTMPKWRGAKKLSKAAKAEWARFHKALQAHEQGHVDLVHKKLKGVAKSLVGKSKEDANTAFQEAVDALQEASDDYDVDTDHGRNKGTIIDTSIK